MYAELSQDDPQCQPAKNPDVLDDELTDWRIQLHRAGSRRAVTVHSAVASGFVNFFGVVIADVIFCHEAVKSD